MLLISKIHFVWLMIVALLVDGTENKCFSSKNGTYKNNIKCAKDDFYCGSWEGRVFKPLGCQYREVAQEQGQKCMKGKTLACIGDSQIRGLCYGLGLFLYGFSEFDEIIDYDDEKNFHNYADCFPNFHNASYVLPTVEAREAGDLDWQIQIYMAFHAGGIPELVHEVLNNKYQGRLNYTGSDVRMNKIDFALWNNGIHDRDLFNSTPYGERYFDQFVKVWLDVRQEVEVPSVWTSMNNECDALINHFYAGLVQVPSVEAANYYTHKRLKELKLPYFDASSVLRTPQRCSLMTDGLHLYRWADLLRGKILLNYLCDDEWNWVGDANAFVQENLD